MKKVKKTNGVSKGAPSGFVISILIHVAAFMLAGLLVVFTVHNKDEKKFVPPKPVERPKMKLKKPKVKVKKNSKPKSSERIVTKVQKANMPEIYLPEMSGIGDGVGTGGGYAGFDLMPDLSTISVFGGDQSIGSDLEGVVYSLVRGRNGGPIAMDQDSFRDVLRKYVLSGWKDSVLSRYYRLPKKLYSTHVIVPPVPTCMAPGIFGAPELEDYWLFVKYEGQLVYPEDIKFRFWGVGDAYMFVNVDGKEVLMSAWHFHHPWFDWWQSKAGGDRSHLLGNQRMVVGDWIELKAGEPLPLKVLFGEWNGGAVTGMLLVEVDGVEYPTARTGGPLLPVFKTEELSWDTLTEISRFLAADECSLTTGPVFNDYYSGTSSIPLDASSTPEPEPPQTAEKPDERPVTRIWTTLAGQTLEAEFMTSVGGNAILKTANRKQIKVPLSGLSEEDREYITLEMPPKLDINFSKTTKPRKFGPTYNAKELTARGNFYTFSTRIKQTSTRPYGQPLTAEFFAIGDEIGGQKNILLDYQKKTFTLTEENDYSVEFGGPPVELLDYVINEERRGKRYGGFLVVIKDARGEVIAYQTPSENLYRNLDHLRQIRVGWYFDKDCNRCLPTPPRPFAVAANTN
ncbi:SHD1 domain-containing protein [Pontiellaceae bacterium B1224]|nr:SHD1 domain-containing protein [Pontiellaceae bacterium B1224]